MKRKVYWSVEKAVWGANKSVHFFFMKKANAEKFAHDNECCRYPEKHTATENVYAEIPFEESGMFELAE